MLKLVVLREPLLAAGLLLLPIAPAPLLATILHILLTLSHTVLLPFPLFGAVVVVVSVTQLLALAQPFQMPVVSPFPLPTIPSLSLISEIKNKAYCFGQQSS